MTFEARRVSADAQRNINPVRPHWKLAVVFQRLGPYHLARLSAAAQAVKERSGSLLALEISQTDKTYAWDVETGPVQFERITLFPKSAYESLKRGEIRSRMNEVLSEQVPDVLALPGWHFEEALAGLAWAKKNRRATVVMSESSYHDHPRIFWREWVKRLRVKQFDAGFVGGNTHRRYLESLGMESSKVTLGYDVIDNNYFADGAKEVRSNEKQLRLQHNLPGKYFLCCARFVPEKNLEGLLQAYAWYAPPGESTRGTSPWHLVLCGDGPLRDSLKAKARELGIESLVHFRGFVQYPDLPTYYGLASAFILPSLVEPWGLVVNEAMASGLPVIVSEQCGCASELVQPGVNGYTFSPTELNGLSRRMEELTEDESLAKRMGKESSLTIAEFGSSRFGAGLMEAVSIACRSRFGREIWTEKMDSSCTW